MEVRFKGSYNNIKSFEWINIPKLSLITGLNGVGKTNLLYVLSQSMTAKSKRRLIENNSSVNDIKVSLEYDEDEVIMGRDTGFILPSKSSQVDLSFGSIYALAHRIKIDYISSLINIKDKEFRDVYYTDFYSVKKNKEDELRLQGYNHLEVQNRIQSFERSINEEFSFQRDLKIKDLLKNKEELELKLKTLPKFNENQLYNPIKNELIEIVDNKSKGNLLNLTPKEIIYYIPTDIFVKRNNEFILKLELLTLLHYLKINISSKFEELDSNIGLSPVDTINEAIKWTSLDYRLEVSSELDPEDPLDYFESGKFFPELIRNSDGVNVSFQSLSSGERVLMSLALQLYSDVSSKQSIKVAFLDEPDSHLHPSMIKDLYNILYKYFVKERGVRVFMTTHNPTTVALLPDQSSAEVFELRSPTEIVKIGLDVATRNLTEGLITVTDNSRFVIVEGQDDKPFYEAVYKILLDAKILPQSPSLVFIPGKNKESVEHFVSELNKGLVKKRYYGIVDRDYDEDSEGLNVFTIKRKCIENYLVDPIVAFFTARHDFKGFEKFALQPGEEHDIEGMSNEKIQEIADFIFECVEKNSESLVEVEFVNGSKLKYPNWMIENDGKNELLPLYRNAVKNQKTFHHKYLIQNLKRTKMVPGDLIQLFKSIIA